jgi:hypothetical protein
MKASVAVAKEADAKKEFSATKSDKSNHHVRNEPEKQLGSLRGVIDNIRRNGGTQSVDSIATELSSMYSAQRASVLLALQRTHGNRYVQRVVKGIQAKLKVGQPGDKYEQEADRVADAVMRMPEPQVHRQAEEEKEEERVVQPKLKANIEYFIQRQVEEEENLQAKETPGHIPEVTLELESRIYALEEGGQPLPESVRTFFEPRFGYDFSQVRVHTDIRVAESARAMNARAFTVGRNILFGTGWYAPGTNTGRKLLAHELTHVIQQNGKSNVRQKSGLPRTPHSLQQLSARARTAAAVPSLRVDGVIQRTASVRHRRRVDNRPDLIRFEMDRPASREALIEHIRTDLVAALSTVVWTPIVARIRELSDDLDGLFDQTESQSQISFELSVVWFNPTTVGHLSLLSPYVEPSAASVAEAPGQEREAEGGEAPTFQQTHSIGNYIDLYERVIYDLFNPPGPGNANSTTLHVYYRDGTYITIDLYDISESQSDLATELRHLYEGEGNRVFPEVMNHTTVPNLWRAKHEALRAMDDYNVTFVMETVPIVLMFASMVIGAGGGGQFSSRRIPRARARRVYQWPPRVPGFGGPAARIRPVNGHVSVGGGTEGNAAARTNLQPFEPGTGGPSPGAPIPNLVQGRASEIGRLFEPGSIRLLTSERLTYRTVRWEQFALGAREAMAPGGRVLLNVWCQTQAEVQHVINTFRQAGFQNVRAGIPGLPGTAGGAGTMITAIR